MDTIRVGVVDIEHNPLTTNDHLTCGICTWAIGVTPRDTAVRLAKRHDESHQERV